MQDQDEEAQDDASFVADDEKLSTILRHHATVRRIVLFCYATIVMCIVD